MGYDLHITRREFWSDDEGQGIPLTEWRGYVEQDPELEPDSENPGDENFVFVTHSDRWPLWWRDGEIYTKNPDAVVVAKLVAIARTLAARVLGDDDEIYGVDPANPTKTQAR